MILVIDNYDSFTYNLVCMIKSITKEVLVYRNDKINLNDIKILKPSHILLSPGPGRPENAGICIDLINNFLDKIPILGVCLGHQAIGYAFGAKIIQADELVHGKSSLVYHDGKNIYSKLENPFSAGRYHSLVIDRKKLPKELIITAETNNGTIMGVRHKHYPLEGVQFHPESVLTPVGQKILTNWLKFV